MARTAISGSDIEHLRRLLESTVGAWSVLVLLKTGDHLNGTIIKKTVNSKPYSGDITLLDEEGAEHVIDLLDVSSIAPMEMTEKMRAVLDSRGFFKDP